MSKKPKFKPALTRVKLNPEQAVLNCACYNSGRTMFSNNCQGSQGAYVAGCHWAGRMLVGSYYYAYCAWSSPAACPGGGGASSS
jgi:hypothetical protein